MDLLVCCCASYINPHEKNTRCLLKLQHQGICFDRAREQKHCTLINILEGFLLSESSEAKPSHRLHRLSNTGSAVCRLKYKKAQRQEDTISDFRLSRHDQKTDEHFWGRGALRCVEINAPSSQVWHTPTSQSAFSVRGLANSTYCMCKQMAERCLHVRVHLRVSVHAKCTPGITLSYTSVITNLAVDCDGGCCFVWLENCTFSDYCTE